MCKVLLLYSTTDGHTRKIARYLRDHLDRGGYKVTLYDISDEEKPVIDDFDKIVIAASIRYGKFNRVMRRYADFNAKALNGKATAFLSVNLIARKPEKSSPETNIYTRKFLHRSKWKPNLVYVVAGMLDYPKYNFLDRNIIRFIMKITGGPTDPTSTVEFTDWDKVKAFAGEVAEL